MQAAQALTITFHNAKLLLVSHEGQPFVPMKPVVEGMGVSWSAQFVKLTSGRFASTVSEIEMVAADGKLRSMTCLPLRKLSGWLMSIHPNKVKPELRDNIIAYQNECDDALWAYWNDGVAVRTSTESFSSILGQTIGTDGFHCLGAVLDGKLRQLPSKARQRAKMHVWSQVHKAFSVVSAQDIPADQLDSARNFIAAYVIEGEWLPNPEQLCGTVLNDRQLYDVYFVCTHFEQLYDIFKRYNLYTHLSGIGSRVGVEMIDHFKDGWTGVHSLKGLAREFEAVQQRLRLNKYAAR